MSWDPVGLFVGVCASSVQCLSWLFSFSHTAMYYGLHVLFWLLFARHMFTWIKLIDCLIDWWVHGLVLLWLLGVDAWLYPVCGVHSFVSRSFWCRRDSSPPLSLPHRTERTQNLQRVQAKLFEKMCFPVSQPEWRVLIPTFHILNVWHFCVFYSVRTHP